MKRFNDFLMTVFVLVFVGGCSTIPIEQTKDCFGFKPIRPTNNDVTVISNRLAREILAHDTHGAGICNWKP